MGEPEEAASGKRVARRVYGKTKAGTFGPSLTYPGIDSQEVTVG